MTRYVLRIQSSRNIPKPQRRDYTEIIPLKLPLGFGPGGSQGSTFRIYQIGSLEVRTTQMKFGKEKVGAIFSSRSLAERVFVSYAEGCLYIYIYITHSGQRPGLVLRFVPLCVSSCVSSCVLFLFGTVAALLPQQQKDMKKPSTVLVILSLSFFFSFFRCLGLFGIIFSHFDCLALLLSCAW